MFDRKWSVQVQPQPQNFTSILYWYINASNNKYEGWKIDASLSEIDTVKNIKTSLSAEVPYLLSGIWTLYSTGYPSAYGSLNML